MRIVGLVLRALSEQLDRFRLQRELFALRQPLRDVVDRTAADPEAVEADRPIRQPGRRFVALRGAFHFLTERTDGSERSALLLRKRENPESQNPNPKSQEAEATHGY